MDRHRHDGADADPSGSEPEMVRRPVQRKVCAFAHRADGHQPDAARMFPAHRDERHQHGRLRHTVSGGVYESLHRTQDAPCAVALELHPDGPASGAACAGYVERPQKPYQSPDRLLPLFSRCGRGAVLLPEKQLTGLPVVSAALCLYRLRETRRPGAAGSTADRFLLCFRGVPAAETAGPGQKRKGAGSPRHRAGRRDRHCPERRFSCACRAGTTTPFNTIHADALRTTRRASPSPASCQPLSCRVQARALTTEPALRRPSIRHTFPV